MFFGKSPRFSHHFLIFGSGTADVIDKRLISRTGNRVDTGTSLREDGNDIALHFHFAVTTVSDLFGNSVVRLPESILLFCTIECILCEPPALL